MKQTECYVKLRGFHNLKIVDYDDEGIPIVDVEPQEDQAKLQQQIHEPAVRVLRDSNFYNGSVR